MARGEGRYNRDYWRFIEISRDMVETGRDSWRMEILWRWETKSKCQSPNDKQSPKA